MYDVNDLPRSVCLSIKIIIINVKITLCIRRQFVAKVYIN